MTLLIALALATFSVVYGIDHDNVALAILGCVCLAIDLLMLWDRIR